MDLPQFAPDRDSGARIGRSLSRINDAQGGLTATTRGAEAAEVRSVTAVSPRITLVADEQAAQSQGDEAGDNAHGGANESFGGHAISPVRLARM